MKTTFKKSMAALSAAAVVAASAAVFAFPADAATGTLTVGTVTVSLDDLAASNYEVVVPIEVSGTNGWNELGYGISYNVAEITATKAASGTDLVMAAVLEGCQLLNVPAINNDLGIIWAGATTLGVGSTVYYSPDGVILNVTFKVNENAAAGDRYDITALVENNGTAQMITTAGGTDVCSLVSGAIIIEGEAPTTTTTTTTQATTTTTAKKGSTESPKTGDVLPVAGAAAALVVIGGVALVAKKRK